MAIPEDGLLAAKPTNLTFAEAAPSPEGSHYVLSFIRTATIHSGQRVLVNGATGAIGSAAVQLLKSIGADVTATCDARNVELVRGLGADRVIDPRILPRTSRCTTWSSTRWERARSADAGDC
jgi:NADPH:quinone reductase-like Zn-dependent oxidoreductase